MDTVFSALRKKWRLWRADKTRAAKLRHFLGTRIRNRLLYEQALTHRSSLQRQKEDYLLSNERMEFLGDAVLGLVVADFLYRSFPNETEGFLTPLRAKLVSREALARYAEKLQLGSLIHMSDHMLRSGGRRNHTILSDTLEAVIGALYLDRGMKASRCFIYRAILEPTDLHRLAAERNNYKSMLLEYAQARKWEQPQYHVLLESGPSHDRTFTVEVTIAGISHGRGDGRSKKVAEQQAASDALADFKNEDTL